MFVLPDGNIGCVHSCLAIEKVSAEGLWKATMIVEARAGALETASDHTESRIFNQIDAVSLCDTKGTIPSEVKRRFDPPFATTPK